MKSAIIVLVLASMASAHAVSLDKCFQSDSTKVGRIQMTDNTVRIDWDLNDPSRSSIESGIVEELKQSDRRIAFQVYLQGVGDGGSVAMILKGKSIKVQPLWSDGSPVGKPDTYPIVNCPAL